MEAVRRMFRAGGNPGDRATGVSRAAEIIPGRGIIGKTGSSPSLPTGSDDAGSEPARHFGLRQHGRNHTPLYWASPARRRAAIHAVGR